MLHWTLSAFDKLSLTELYAIMRLRQEVFVLEQKCPFIDADGKDQASYHLSGYLDNDIAAYARIVPPGVIYKEPSIGRIVTATKHRQAGYGKQLMEKSLRETENFFGNTAIRIMAQQYLKRFYEYYGFKQLGEPFLEDDIWHIIMLRPAL
jgi:ElaA protein